MRGSPLLRSVMILLALVASGMALARLTASKPRVPVLPVTVRQSEKSAPFPYRLVLSSEASKIAISAHGKAPQSALDGSLEVSSDAKFIALTIRWKSPPAANEHRFAKLTLDPPGKPTITRIFDSTGDIDDIVELP